MGRPRVASAWGLLIAAAAIQSPGQQKEADVQIAGLGSLRGSVVWPAQDNGVAMAVARFLRVPYAKAPVGDLRWRSPQPHGPWSGELNSTEFGPACPGAGGGAQTSENCLFLNIFSPLKAVDAAGKRYAPPPNQRLPVLVWFHEGGFSAGSSNLGSAAAAEELVAHSGGGLLVVTVAYRLGVLGFLGGGARIAGRSKEGSMGNFGLEDQQCALEWVRDFIQRFGGNPQHVTIAGAGAGGASVLQHLVRGDAFALYSGAIMQGAPLFATVTQDQAKANYETLLRSTGCDAEWQAPIGCLLKLDEAELRQHASGAEFNWWPVVQRTPMQLIAKGEYNRRPSVLLGFSRDAWASPMLRDPSTFPKAMGTSEQDHALASLLGDSGLELALKDRMGDSRWNLSNTTRQYSQQWWKSLRTLSDWLVGTCPHRHAADKLADWSHSVYLYEWAEYQSEETPGNASSSSFEEFLVPHGSEVEHWLSMGQAETPAQRDMRAYLINFVRTGDPNKPGMPVWPAFAQSGDLLRLPRQEGASGARAQGVGGTCDLWEAWRADQTPDEGPLAGGLVDRHLVLLETAPLQTDAAGNDMSVGPLGAVLGGGKQQRWAQWLVVGMLACVSLVGIVLMASACRVWPGLEGEDSSNRKRRTRSLSRDAEGAEDVAPAKPGSVVGQRAAEYRLLSEAQAPDTTVRAGGRREQLVLPSLPTSTLGTSPIRMLPVVSRPEGRLLSSQPVVLVNGGTGNSMLLPAGTRTETSVGSVSSAQSRSVMVPSGLRLVQMSAVPLR